MGAWPQPHAASRVRGSNIGIVRFTRPLAACMAQIERTVEYAALRQNSGDIHYGTAGPAGYA